MTGLENTVYPGIPWTGARGFVVWKTALENTVGPKNTPNFVQLCFLSAFTGLGTGVLLKRTQQKSIKNNSNCQISSRLSVFLSKNIFGQGFVGHKLCR